MIHHSDGGKQPIWFSALDTSPPHAQTTWQEKAHHIINFAPIDSLHDLSGDAFL